MGKHGSGSSGIGPSGGKSGGKNAGTPMTQSAASRIQSSGAKGASSKTSQSGFASRAQSAGDKNAHAQNS